MTAPARPRGTLVLSLDFELHWGVHDKLTLAQYRDNLLGVRQVVPALLELFAEEDVRATWATVGLLFFESKRELLASLPERRPSYRERALSGYRLLDTIGNGEEDDPFHFAPSLIAGIAATPGQEIGTHTFSHFYCLESGQGIAEFRDDLRAAIRVARAKLGRAPESIVFPRNQCNDDYLAVCRELGFIAYRGNADRWLHRARPTGAESWVRRGVRLMDSYLPLTGTVPDPYPTVGQSGLVDVTATRYLRPWVPMGRIGEPLRLRRIVRLLEEAAWEGGVVHLWWHPHDFGRHVDENMAVLRRILAAFARLRVTHGMRSCTMADLAREALAATPSAPARAAGGE